MFELLNTNPKSSTEKMSYAQELELRIDELIEWAIANQPHKLNHLTQADFTPARSTFCTIAKGGGKLVTQEPEPSEGGAQYINDNPAPWP